MNTGRMLFAQLLDFLSRYEFNRCVRRYRGNFRCRSSSCYDQFLCVAFAQLTGCESLRQIETCLAAMEKRLYHLGLRGSPARSLSEIQQILDEATFEKEPISQLLSQCSVPDPQATARKGPSLFEM